MVAVAQRRARGELESQIVEFISTNAPKERWSELRQVYAALRTGLPGNPPGQSQLYKNSALITKTWQKAKAADSNGHVPDAEEEVSGVSHDQAIGACQRQIVERDQKIIQLENALRVTKNNEAAFRQLAANQQSHINDLVEQLLTVQ